MRVIAHTQILHGCITVTQKLDLVTLGEPKRRESATLGVFAEKSRGKNLPLGIPWHSCRETPRFKVQGSRFFITL